MYHGEACPPTGGGAAAGALLAPAELVSDFGGGVWYHYRRLSGSVVVRLSAVCRGRGGDLMLNGLFFSTTSHSVGSLTV